MSKVLKNISDTISILNFILCPKHTAFATSIYYLIVGFNIVDMVVLM